MVLAQTEKEEKRHVENAMKDTAFMFGVCKHSLMESFGGTSGHCRHFYTFVFLLAAFPNIVDLPSQPTAL